MAEQSPATVAARAFVMVAFLVIISVVALFGKALPEWVDEALGSWRSPNPPAVAQAAEEAPLFEPLLRTHAGAAESPGTSAPAWPSNPSAERAVPSATGLNPSASPVLAATYEAPADSRTSTLPGQSICGPADQTQMLVPASHEQPATAPPDQFHAICQRLKELGSTYVLLESWGDAQEQFRFYCKIAIAGNPHYTYRFEATDADPLAAMTNVLRQVEVWRAARYGN